MANKVELYNNGTLIGTDNSPVVSGSNWTYSIAYTADAGNDVLTAKAFVDNVEVASSGVRNVVVNAGGGGSLILVDDFEDNTLSAEWVHVTGGLSTVTETGGRLNIKANSTGTLGTERVRSTTNVASNQIAHFENVIIQGDGGYNNGLGLWQDIDNYAVIQSRNTTTATNYRWRVVSGSNVLADIMTTIPMANSTVRIVRNGTDVTPQYWNGTSWVNISATVAGFSSAAMPLTMYVTYSNMNVSADKIAIVEGNYSTQSPV